MNQRHCSRITVLLVLCWGSASLAGPIDDETMKAFLTHVENSARFEADARRFVHKEWQQRRDDHDAAAFLVEALSILSPEFRGGLDAYEDDNYALVLSTMHKIASNQDPYLSANASVFAVKALVQLNRLSEAEERLELFLEDPTAVDLHTYYAAEMAYIKGYVELQNLQYDRAAVSLSAMLERYPDAAQRLRVTARQMLAELRSRAPERIGDVADLMTYAGRRLGHFNTGADVQERQDRAIELLDQLIEEAEKNEQSGGGGAGSGDSGKRPPTNPMEDSQLPGGGGEGVHLRSPRKVQPGKVWGAMPPAQREKILQSLRDSFPSRYRQLVEQYYEELAKQP